MRIVESSNWDKADHAEQKRVAENTTNYTVGARVNLDSVPVDATRRDVAWRDITWLHLASCQVAGRHKARWRAA